MTIRSKILADSVSPRGHRLTSFEIYYPRILLAEVNTHKMLSKSTESSRAVPVKTRIQQVKDDPYIPKAFGKNRPGMQAAEDLAEDSALRSKEAWSKACGYAIVYAEQLAALGVHKQLANRILEPYAHVNTVLTGTEWRNFFGLRTHKDAQPEFQELALVMLEQYKASVPRVLSYNDWHLPYVTEFERAQWNIDNLLKFSAARCARVSYKPHGEGENSADKDRALSDHLVASGHMSPFEHQGRPLDIVMNTNEDQRNFVGWVPQRVGVERAISMKSRNFFRVD